MEHIVTAGQNLQTILDLAQSGDTIVLEAGASFVGNFQWKPRAGEFINLVSSRLGEIPSGRVSPANIGLMPRIISLSADPALTVLPGSHHLKCEGIAFVQGSEMTYDLIRLGDGRTSGDQRTLESIPHHFTFEKCLVMARDEASQLQRGIALHSAYVDILNSHISGCKWRGAEAQGIGGWNGSGQYRIINNYIEGAGENILIGGAQPAIPNLCPSGFEIRRNHLFKPLSWKGVFTCKNSLEFKTGKNIVVEGNLIENCWVDAQNGMSVLFTVRPNDSGSGALIEDVKFVNNRIINVAGGLSILGIDNLYSDQQVRLRRILVGNNEWKINSVDNGGNGRPFQLMSGADEVTLERNLVESDGWHAIMLDGEPLTKLILKGNVIAHREYGIFGSGKGTGTPALDFFAPGGVFTNNYLYDSFAPNYVGRYPAGFELSEPLPSLPTGVGLDRAALEAAMTELTEMPPLPPPPPPVPPAIRKVAWPTGEQKQSAILDSQWKDRYRMKRHLSGAWAEFEKVD